MRDHHDTYVEEYHRHFFTKYAQGAPPRKCGVHEKHIGGLIGVIPIVAFYKDDEQTAKKAAQEHLSLTHLGTAMEDTASLLTEVLLQTLNGTPLEEALIAERGKERNPFAHYPFPEWLDDADEMVVGGRFSTA